jgi:short-subunit dehydrogenase
MDGVVAKVVAITGASSGIGAAIATALARPDRIIRLIGRDAGRLEAVASACRAKGADCLATSLDVRQPAATAFLQSLDLQHSVDLLILNAGILDGRRDGETVEDGATAQSVLETNLLATLANLHAVLPGMRRRRQGTILIVASLAAFVPLADAPAYSASKAALVSYGLALREALRDDGINVIVACPGFVATAMAQAHIGHRPGEISADSAAQTILEGLRRNTALIGFPRSAFWLSRLALFAPEWFRYRRMKATRFHVAPLLPSRLHDGS